MERDALDLVIPGNYSMGVGIFLPTRVASRQGEWFTKSFVPRQMAALAARLGLVDLISFTAPSRQSAELKQTLPKEEFRVNPVPGKDDGFRLLLTGLPALAGSLRRIIHSRASEWSSFIVYEGSIPSQLAFRIARAAELPVFVWIGGDAYASMARRVNDYSWAAKTSRLLLAKQNRWALRSMARHSAGVIVTGQELAEHYRSIAPAVRSFVATTVSAVSVDASLPELRFSRRQVPVRLLTVGRITPVKGLEYLLRAIVELRDSGMAFQLKFAGPEQEAGYAARLKSEIAALGASEWVEFCGEIPSEKMEEAYREADIFILPSLSEGTPKVLPEAMAKGLPIIATTVGAVPEIVGDAGILLEPRDVQGLSAALLRLGRDPELRLKLGQNAVRRARGYTLENQIHGIGDWMTGRISHDVPACAGASSGEY